MPRRYRLGRRAAQADETRARIVEAAIELYAQQGISATTLRQVGARADVAPGTLRSHFPTRELLDEALVERAMAEMPLPDAGLLDAGLSLEVRLARLIRATGAFLDGAARWYRMWQREPMMSRPWNEAGARYGASWEGLFRAALGPLADDPESMAIVRGLLQPAIFDSLRAEDRTTSDVADMLIALMTPWFTTRAAALQPPSGAAETAVGERRA